MVAGDHEQTEHTFLQDAELARLQRSFQAPGLAGDLVRPRDNPGIKVEGEGEWNACKPGGQKRRGWRKIHIRCPAGE